MEVKETIDSNDVHQETSHEIKHENSGSPVNETARNHEVIKNLKAF